jgi:hypothetical protein
MPTPRTDAPDTMDDEKIPKEREEEMDEERPREAGSSDMEEEDVPLFGEDPGV